jgi:hypothetical protein
MEDLSGLAARVAASVSDLRGCLILDRDGLVLGVHPEGQEATIKSSWLRFAGLGEAEKGFIEFGDVMWAFVRRGPYAAFAVAGTQTRPGFVMDQLEQILFTAEEVRSRREALRLPDVASAPSSRPRTPLHPETRPTPAPTSAPSDAAPAQGPAAPAAAGAPPVRPPVRPSPAGVPPVLPARTGPSGAPPQGPSGVRPQAAPARPASGPTAEPSPAPGPASGSEAAPPSSPAPSRPEPAPSVLRREPAPSASRPEPGPSAAEPEPAPAASEPEQATPPATPQKREDDGEVDPVLLAQEFSRLLQETAGGDET